MNFNVVKIQSRPDRTISLLKINENVISVFSFDRAPQVTIKQILWEDMR